MAKSKSQPATAVKNPGIGGRKSRGKRSPRRWAQKLEGSIINHNRKINHDDAGKPFPGERSKKPVDPLLAELAVLQKALAVADSIEPLTAQGDTLLDLPIDGPTI